MPEEYLEGLVGCFCPLDQDGECRDCRAEMVQGCKAAMSTFSRMLVYAQKQPTGENSGSEFLEEFRLHSKAFEIAAPCVACHQRYIDLVVSGFIPLLEGSPHLFAEAYVQSLIEICAQDDIKEMPLTKKAWNDLRNRKHWF